MKRYTGPVPINIGTGEEVTNHEQANSIAEVVGFDGDLEFDSTRPDGTPCKLFDPSRLREMGWTSSNPIAGRIALHLQLAFSNRPLKYIHGLSAKNKRGGCEV